MSGSLEYVGHPWIYHVAQPLGSEKCFAAIVASVASITDVEGAHEAMVSAGLSEEDGSTYPMAAEEKLRVGGGIVDLLPFQGKLGLDEGGADDFMEQIDKQFEAERAVALLHKKKDDPEDPSHHWTLLSGGFMEENGPSEFIHVLDPLKERSAFLRSERVAQMVSWTLEFRDPESGIRPGIIHAVSLRAE